MLWFTHPDVATAPLLPIGVLALGSFLTQLPAQLSAQLSAQFSAQRSTRPVTPFLQRLQLQRLQQRRLAAHATGDHV
jgi:hypothetical protein